MRRAPVLFVLALLLAGCTVPGTEDDAADQGDDGEDDQADRPVPQLSLTRRLEDGGERMVFTVVKVTRGPLPWSDLEVTPSACAWTEQYNETSVSAGDSLSCPSRGTLRIVHVPSQTVLFQNDLG